MAGLILSADATANQTPAKQPPVKQSPVKQTPVKQTPDKQTPDKQAPDNQPLPVSPRVEAEPIDALSQVSTTPTVGMQGTYFLAYEGSTLSVKPSRDEGDLQVRIAGMTPAANDKKPNYEIRFVGYRAGFYDLRDYLVGQPSDEEVQLPPMPVEVRTNLGGDPRAELTPVQPPPMIEPVRYRLLLVLFCTLWLIPLVWLGLRRLA